MDDDSLLNALKKGREKNEKGTKPHNGPDHLLSDLDSTDSGSLSPDSIGESVVLGNGGVKEPDWGELGINPIEMPKLAMPIIPKEPKITEGIYLSSKQKRSICTFAYAMDVLLHQAIEAPAIYSAWPIEGEADASEINAAGPRPLLSSITNWLGEDEFRQKMLERGVTIGASVGKLLPEQIALISILTDTSSKAAIGTRLKKAGITWPVYHAWRRQKLFAEALSAAAGGALTDSIENSDVQLANLAQSGDLNAIKYLNEMTGRSPNDAKAVDAQQFAKVVLDAVQKVVTSDQAREIANLVSIEAKKIGLSR